jgi:hypothetical protein
MGKVIILVDKNGLGITAKSADGNSLIIGNGYAVVGGVQLDVAYAFRRLADAEDIGITAANDTANNMLVHYHIDEYFRKAPGTKLWFMPVATGETLEDLVGVAGDVLQSLAGEVRNLGFISNKTDVEMGALTIVDGLPEEVGDALSAASILWEDQRTRNRPLACILIEGFKFSGTPGSAADLRANEATGVGVVIAQDTDIVFGSKLSVKHHAAVGTALGVKAGRTVETNIGETEGNDLQDKALGRWINPGLSSNTLASALNDDPNASDYDLLTEKGYIFPRAYQGYPGVFFDDDPSCDLATSDFYSLSNTAVYVKAHREIYASLVGEVNKKIFIDTASGNITAADCARFENLGNDVIGATGFMTRAAEISGGKTFCDPNQNVLGTSEVKVGYEIVPVGYSRAIKGSISFTKKIS